MGRAGPWALQPRRRAQTMAAIVRPPLRADGSQLPPAERPLPAAHLAARAHARETEALAGHSRRLGRVAGVEHRQQRESASAKHLPRARHRLLSIGPTKAPTLLPD